MKTRRIDCVLGVDVGGTKTACAAVDRDGAILLRTDVRSPSDDGDEMMGALLDLISRSIEGCAELDLAVRAVGVGAAGFILQPEGLMLEAPNIAWRMVPVKRLVAERIGLPSFLDNDANVAASGERFAGVCRGVDDFAYITLGTGIGGGIFVGGSIYRGYRGTGAEIGHMVVDPDGPPCECGGRGCLEALASGTALERAAVKLVAADPDSALWQACGGDLAGLTGEMVSEAAEGGDNAALASFSDIAYYLGLGIVSLIHALGPEKVVLGGGVSHSGHLLLDDVRRVVAERGIPVLVESVSIELSTLGTEAGLIGAAALAWEGIGTLR